MADKSLEPQKPKISEASAADTPLKGMRILIIDDCEDNQYLFTRLLTRKGAAVTSAGDGLEGLHLAYQDNFDLVLLDIQMPVMDGFATMEHLEAKGYSSPVIALTGFSRAADKRDILKSGFADVVTKPVDPQALVQSILDAVRSSSAAGSGRQ